MMNQNVMRDPLRAGMEARAHGLPKLLLGVAAVLVFFALEMKNCAGMEGAAAVALIGAACMALLTFGAWRALKEQPVMVLLCAAMLAMLAVAAHLAMLDIKPGRVSKVLAPMLEEMWNYDLGTAMAWEDGAWSGGYLIVMALISSFKDRVIDEKTIVFGEVGLSGEIRAVSMAKQRVMEARKLGFTTVILPEACKKSVGEVEGMELRGVRTVRDVMYLMT